MRWQVITQATPCGLRAFCSRLPQLSHFAQQQVNLPLLTGNDLIQLLNQIFGISRFDFKSSQALVCAVWIRHTACCDVVCYKFRSYWPAYLLGYRPNL